MTEAGAASPFVFRERRHLARWGACLFAALGLHGGAALALLEGANEDEAAGTPPAVTIDLSALSPATPRPAEAAVPGPEETQTDAAAADAAADAAVAAAKAEPPLEEAAPAPTPSAETKEPAAAPASVPDAKPASNPEVALAPPPEAPQAKPEEGAPPPPPPPEKPPEREQRRKRAREGEAAPPMRSASATTAPAAAALRATAAHAAAPMGSVGNASSLPKWKVRLAAHLQRHKRYPAQAQAAGQQGVAMVQFTLDRHGRVIASRLAHSSGSAALDRETLALIQRAQPLPPPPADVPGDTFSFTVPFRFNMR